MRPLLGFILLTITLIPSEAYSQSLQSILRTYENKDYQILKDMLTEHKLDAEYKEKDIFDGEYINNVLRIVKSDLDYKEVLIINTDENGRYDLQVKTFVRVENFIGSKTNLDSYFEELAYLVDRATRFYLGHSLNTRGDSLEKLFKKYTERDFIRDSYTADYYTNSKFYKYFVATTDYFRKSDSVNYGNVHSFAWELSDSVLTKKANFDARDKFRKQLKSNFHSAYFRYTLADYMDNSKSFDLSADIRNFLRKKDTTFYDRYNLTEDNFNVNIWHSFKVLNRQSNQPTKFRYILTANNVSSNVFSCMVDETQCPSIIKDENTRTRFSLKSKNGNRFITVKLFKTKPTKFLLDTGANISMIKKEDHKTLEYLNRISEVDSVTVETASDKLNVLQVTVDKINLKDNTLKNVKFVVGDHRLFGTNILDKLGNWKIDDNSLVID